MTRTADESLEPMNAQSDQSEPAERTVRIGFVGGYESDGPLPTRLIAYSHTTQGRVEHVYVLEPAFDEVCDD